MILIRLLMPQDVPDVLNLAKMQVEETLPHLTFDPDITRMTLEQSIDFADPTIFVAEKDRKVIGYLMALINSYAFTDGIFTVQEVLYVHPDNRGSRAAAKLVKAFIDWSDRLEAKETIFGISNGFQPERTASFFEHFGAKRCGFYLKKLR